MTTLRTVSAVQSNYIPWKGLFHIIQKSDAFVSLEDVQYTVRDWRNRNKVKLPDGTTKWLTVPVLGGRNQVLHDVRIDDTQDWRRTHIETLRFCYGKAPHFARYFPRLEEIYREPYERLVDLNFALLAQVVQWLGISTELLRTDSLDCPGRKDEKLICIVRRLNGTRYLSGPAARAYMVLEDYERSGLEIEYMSYDSYPEYPQLSAPFDHHVTVLDLLFMTGEDAPCYIWG